MNWHIFERFTTQIGIVGLFGMGSVIRSTDEIKSIAPEVPAEVYVVGWMGIVTILMIRFAIKYGKHVPRTPNGELSRYKEAQDKKFTEYKTAQNKKYDDLHKKVDRACEDMSAIKRDIELLVVGNGEDK